MKFAKLLLWLFALSAVLLLAGAIWWLVRGDTALSSPTPEAPPAASERAAANAPQETPVANPPEDSAATVEAPAAPSDNAPPEQPAPTPSDPASPPKEGAAPEPPSTDGMTPEEEREAIKGGIREAVDKVGPKMRDCYQALLSDFPSASGDISVTFEIKAKRDGPTVVDVAQIGRGTTLFEEDMQKCVLSAITEIEVDLPPSVDGAKATYPFHFRSEREPDTR